MFQPSAAAAFVAPLQPPRHGSLCLKTLLQSRDPRRLEQDDDEQEGVVVLQQLTDRVSGLLSRPTPGFSSGLPIGYPLALATAAVLLPLPTSLLLGVSFVGYYSLASQLVDQDDNNNDDDRPPIDLAALGGAVATAGLLSPSGLAVEGGLEHVLGAAAVAVAGSTIALAVRQEDDTRAEEELLRDWDNQFLQDNYQRDGLENED